MRDSIEIRHIEGDDFVLVFDTEGDEGRAGADARKAPGVQDNTAVVCCGDNCGAQFSSLRCGATEERLLTTRAGRIERGRLVGDAVPLEFSVHLLIDDGSRRVGGKNLEGFDQGGREGSVDRKSTRLNSS